MPIDPFFGSLASAGGSLVGSIANGLFGGAQVRRQLKANKELAQYQFDLNRQQWQAENEYNSPKAQMQRLRDAGLNPNLVYGSGSVSGNTTTAGPRFESPKASKNDRWDFANLAAQAITMYQDMQQKQANIDLARAQTNAVNENAQLTAVERAWRIHRKDSDAKWLDKERDLRTIFTDWQGRNEAFKYQRGVSLFGHELQAIQLSNEEARARLRNAALDAVLKKDTHERNKAMLDSYKYQGDLGRWSSSYLSEYNIPYDIWGKNPVSGFGNLLSQYINFNAHKFGLW